MISVLYAALLGLLICFLAIQVIKARRREQVKYGDGGNARLMEIRSAHANCTEYSPIFLLLLFGLEYNGGPFWLVHLFGIIFVLGRVAHAWGILWDDFRGRKVGMHATLWPIMALALVNLWYLPWAG
uniref:MAPEG family protein n=1 Tax=Thaumasiovibrio occultus TaxID=1891184 RepID=UPI000B363A25|nr:MAPEG family protein [Thaumasiovibrio occultus]